MIRFIDVYKEYDNGTKALKGIDLRIDDGEFVFLVGPSGSGKSTIIKLITGEIALTQGKLMVNGYSLNNISPRQVPLMRRTLGIIFQDFRLIDKKTVYENLAFAMRAIGASSRDLKRRIPYVLQLVGLDQKADRYPGQLSGGEQQRVAIARALVKMPRVLLLDEPLSNLDARLRLQTREEIRRIQKETGITTVFVTHDQEEAMSISDMIVVMKLGVVQQIGKPQEVYDDPANLFVANFLGTPPINVFSGRVEGGKLFIGDDCVLTVGGLEDQEVTVGIRPEGFILDENGPLTCQLNNVEVMGRDVSVVSTHAASLKPSVRSIIDADDRSGLNGEVVRYSVKPHKLFVFHKETEKRLAFEVK